MAVSIQGVLYSVGMDTANFKAGVNTVEALRKQMASNQAKYASSAIKDELKISNAIDARLKAEQKLQDAYASNATAKEIAKITEEVEKLQKAESKAILQGEKNQAEYQAQLKKTQSEIAKAEKATQSWGAKLGNVNKFVNGLGGALVGAFSARAIYQGFNNIIDNLDTMAKRARDIGITASAMQEISHQANLAGVSAEKLDVGLKTLARTGSKDVKTSMIELAERVEKGTLSVAEANKYFGENALEMIRILGQGKEAVAKMFDAKEIDEAARAAEMYKNAIENLSQQVMPTIYRKTGKIARALAYLFDFERAKTFFTTYQDGSDKVTQDFIAQEMGYKNIDEYLNSAITDEKERLKLLTKENEESKNNLAKLDELDAKLEASRQKELSLTDQLKKGQNDINNLKKEAEQYDEDSIEYGKLYEQIITKTIALESAQAKQRQEIEKQRQEIESAQKAQADERQKELDAAKKQAEAEAKQAASKAKAQADARKDFELQLRLRMLEVQGKIDQAEAIKNALQRNELMEKYGYSIKQATAALKAQKELEKAGSIEYSEKDIEKAKRIVERGEGGTIGKRTLEQAQAILSGKAIEGDAVSMFANAQPKTPNLQIANLDEVQPSAVSQTTQTTQSKSDETQVQTNRINQSILDALKDIKTSLGQYFNNRTAAGAHA